MAPDEECCVGGLERNLNLILGGNYFATEHIYMIKEFTNHPLNIFFLMKQKLFQKLRRNEKITKKDRMILKNPEKFTKP